MKLTPMSGFILLLLLSVLTLALDCPPGFYKSNRPYINSCNDAPSWSVKEFRCETMPGSPLSKDVVEASKALMSRGKGNERCSLETDGENTCVKLITYLSAGVALCGMTDMRGMDCVRIANFVWRLDAKCKQTFEGEEESRVGGRVIFEAGRILVF